MERIAKLIFESFFFSFFYLLFFIIKQFSVLSRIIESKHL